MTDPTVQQHGATTRLFAQNKLKLFTAYDKQKDFFKFDKTKSQRLLLAGNQCRKSTAGAFETACHLTGWYPKWWGGRKFYHGTSGWACGESAEKVLEVLQLKLLGRSEEDPGFIPWDLIIDRRAQHGGGGVKSISVKHASGEISTLTFMSYAQGREMFESSTLDFIWGDEEMPADIYDACLARISATKGIIS